MLCSARGLLRPDADAGLSVSLASLSTLSCADDLLLLARSGPSVNCYCSVRCCCRGPVRLLRAHACPMSTGTS